VFGTNISLIFALFVSITCSLSPLGDFQLSPPIHI